MNAIQSDKVRFGRGFFAALDQSGGSTPKALAEYGIAQSRYSSDAEMFDLVHEMRSRVITSPAFVGSRVLGAILFEQTMEREIRGLPTARYLWEQKHVVPFLKVDKGLADEQYGVQLMKPMDTLDSCSRARTAPVLRHQDALGDPRRRRARGRRHRGPAVRDRRWISAAGLVPILEPEVSIKSPHKVEAERCCATPSARVDALPADATIMLKLTIPTRPAFTPGWPLTLAFWGARPVRRLQPRRGVPAAGTGSRADRELFRALLQGLSDEQTDEQFNARWTHRSSRSSRRRSTRQGTDDHQPVKSLTAGGDGPAPGRPRRGSRSVDGVDLYHRERVVHEVDGKEIRIINLGPASQDDRASSRQAGRAGERVGSLVGRRAELLGLLVH